MLLAFVGVALLLIALPAHGAGQATRVIGRAVEKRLNQPTVRAAP